MTTALQMPVNTGKPQKLGRGLYRKQILPLGKVLNVNGVKLPLNEQLLADIKRTYDEGFLDSTPLNLVDASNSHTDDPEAARGTIRALDLGADGLYATLDLPDSLLEHNPNLGVSPRLLFDQTRADGRKAKVVLRHVAATTDPHIGGMKPFERLADLSNPSEHVVDLTAATYQGDPMATLSDEQLARLAAFADTLGDDGRPTQTADQTAEANGDLSDEDLQALLADLGDDEEQPETDEQPLEVAASASAPSVDLAATDQLRTELTEVQMELAAARWKQAASDYVKAGVPPFLVDAAAKVFDPSTVDLSAGEEQPDPAGVVRQMLDLSKGLVDVGMERGTTAARTDDADADARRQLAANANAHFGIK
jgi:hypothetical protein